jgi:hypothetical protein
MIGSAGTGALTTTGSTSYYHFLTDAFLHGQTSLLVKPRSELLALRDPYDPKANRAYRLHDALLYKGKYYLYWGLSPVLLAYLPVRVLTGRYLTDAAACIIFASLGLLMYAALLAAIRRDTFPTSGSWTTIPLIVLLAFGTMMPFLLRRHLVYEVAITCAYVLTAAIYRGAFRGALHRGWIFASGMALGLVFLCRLNLTVCIVTAVVACVLHARRDCRSALARGQLLGLAFGPLVLCVAAQALYNFVRFGSLTEYGLRYQLSMVPMPNYTFFSLPRGLSSALYIFFNLPIFSTHPPFVMATSHGRPDLVHLHRACSGHALRSRLHADAPFDRGDTHHAHRWATENQTHNAVRANGFDRARTLYVLHFGDDGPNRLRRYGAAG